MKRILITIFLILFLSFPAYVFSGSFKVVPIKLFLDNSTRTEVLKITNDSEEKVTVQLDAKEWSQDKEGEDRYELTGDIVFFPKIITLDKGEERIVRVGYQGKPGAQERTYRLFLQELPVRKPEETTLMFALRLGVPIFIKPLKEIKGMAIEKVELSEGSLKVRVKNSGNIHFIVSKIKAKGIDSSGAEVFSKEIGGWYVLSGISRTFFIDIPREECLKASVIEVSAEVENFKMEGKLDMDKAQCVEKAVSQKGQEKNIQE